MRVRLRLKSTRTLLVSLPMLSNVADRHIETANASAAADARKRIGNAGA